MTYKDYLLAGSIFNIIWVLMPAVGIFIGFICSKSYTYVTGKPRVNPFVDSMVKTLGYKWVGDKNDLERCWIKTPSGTDLSVSQFASRASCVLAVCMPILVICLLIWPITLFALIVYACLKLARYFYRKQRK